MIAQITIENNICENPSHAKSQSGLLNGWGGGGAAVHRVLPSCGPNTQHCTLLTSSALVLSPNTSNSFRPKFCPPAVQTLNTALQPIVQF